MTRKNMAFMIGGMTFCLTLMVTLFREIDLGNIKAIWLIWICMSWNYFAYAFGRGMVPYSVVCDENGKETRFGRELAFWGTAIIYLAFLGVAAFS